jgi:anti-sigma-K factor RskA
MSAKNDDLVNLSGAYVLNALDADEAKAFEAELENSEQTRYEVTELRDTAVVLGLAVAPVAPSPDLKASIMAKIAMTPQLPAEESEHELAPSDAPREFERPGKASRTAQARWFTRPVVVLSSMAAAVALIAGGVVVTGNIGEMQQQQASADKFAAIMTADDTEKVTTEVTGGGTATIAWSSDLESSAVKVSGVDSLPDNKIYELWYIGADGPRAAGTFDADDSGAAWAVLEGTLEEGDTIGVTVEPAGGSQQPTTTPVVAVATA